MQYRRARTMMEAVGQLRRVPSLDQVRLAAEHGRSPMLRAAAVIRLTDPVLWRRLCARAEGEENAVLNRWGIVVAA